MTALASSGVTWGIGGPTFLVGYGVLALAVLLGIIVARQRIAAGPASTAAGELDGAAARRRLPERRARAGGAVGAEFDAGRRDDRRAGTRASAR